MVAYGVRVVGCGKVTTITLHNCNHINEKLFIIQKEVCSVVKAMIVVV